MLSFAETLSGFLKESGFSQKMVADMCGCSRTMIYAVLNSKKQMSEAAFQTLVHEVPLTEEQKKRLRVAYYSDKYPPGIVSKLDLISKRFSSIRVPIVDLSSFSANNAFAEDTAILTKRNLIIIIRSLIPELAKQHEHAEIYTNYPYSEREIDDAVYETLRGIDSPVVFKHIIPHEISGKSDNNVSMIFDSLRYIKLRHVPLVLESADTEYNPSEILYRYYFLGNSFLILFNSDSSGGILLRSPQVISAAQQKIRLIAEACKPLSVLPENYLMLRELLAQSGKLSLQASIDNYVCVGRFINEDILNAIARPDVPNREALIKIAVHHYDLINEIPSFPMFFTAQGFRSFAATGLTQEFPANWTVPMPPEYRKQILRKYIELVSAEKQEMFILNDNLLRFASNERFSIELYGSGMFVLGSISDKSHSYLGEYVSFFSDDSIIAPFKAYLDYIQRNELYYNREYSIHFLNDLIYECDNHIHSEDD